MKDIGSNMAKGQFNGYQEESAKLSKTSGIDAKNVTVDALKSIWDINSPSKVMADEVGTYLGQGLIVGMEDIIKSYDPTTLASGFINKLQSYIFPGLALVASGKGSSLSSMTPVNFGMSQNGSENYMGNISNMPIGMNLPYKSDLQLINQSLQNLTDRMVEQTDSIIAEVGSLRDDVNLVGDRLSHLQVVIDSRTIVGELAPAMNDELLKYGERINRGV
jgi:phage-related protein